MHPQLPAGLLSDYAQKFFGYGRWEAPIWFIGIEEGGGIDILAIYNRLQAWAASGQSNELEDAPGFYSASNNAVWHRPDAKLQPTWKQLIRMLLLARGEADTDDALRHYQRSQLGTATGETCLAELLPRHPRVATTGIIGHGQTFHGSKAAPPTSRKS